MSVFSIQRVVMEPPLRKSASVFIFLDRTQSIAKHAFLVHKSVSYLDLNLSEYSFFKCAKNYRSFTDRMIKGKFISTRESSKKSLAVNRMVLYTYHLDVSSELENSDTKIGIKMKDFAYNYNGALINGIIIPAAWYERRLNQIIIAKLLETQEVEFVKNVLKIMKFINLPGKSVFLLNRCLEILYAQNASSVIIDEFSVTVRLQESDLFFVKSEILEFFLRHGDCKDSNAREFHRRQQWIYCCMSTYKFEQVAPLLKHYCNPKFSETAYKKTKYSLAVASALTEEEMETPVKFGWITKERNFLILQALDIFYSSAFPLLENSRLRTLGTEALRMMWSAIPDILINREELKLLYRSTKIKRDIKQIHKFYSGIVKEDAKVPQPRRLKDYCRVVIRKVLCKNQRLPEGIGQLGLSNTEQSFLNLEHTWLK